MKIEEHFYTLKKAVEDKVMDLEIQRDQVQEQLDEALADLSDAQGTLSQAKALATEIDRRFALRLDPGPTERDFRELLALLTEGS